MVSAVFAILNLNNENKLKDCIESVLHQSHKELAIVVIDGGSTDGSVSLLKAYSGNSPRVRYFVQKEKGIGPARNELLDYLSEHSLEPEVILWGDTEITYDKDYVKNMISLKADVVGGSSIISSSKPLGQALWWLYRGIDGKGILGHCILIRRNLYQRHRIVYPKSVAMDDYFVLNDLQTYGVSQAQAFDAFCYVTTAESLTEFNAWHKRKRKGLSQGFSSPGATSKAAKLAIRDRTFQFYLFSSFFILFCALASVVLSNLLVLFVAAVFLWLFSFSCYLWLNGRKYVISMRKMTFFLLVPVFYYHYTRIITSWFIETFKRAFRQPY